MQGTLVDVAAACARLGVLITFDPRNEATVVRGYFLDRTRDELLQSIASQVSPDSVVVERPGGVAYIGPPSDSDMLVEVYPVPEGDAQIWAGAYRLAASPRSQVEPVKDYILVRDTPQGLQAVREVHERLRAVRKQFTCDVTFVELSENASKQLGVDWSLDGAFGLSAGTGAGTSDSSFVLALKSSLASLESRGSARVVNSGQLHVVEGGHGQMKFGDSTPILAAPVVSNGVVIPSNSYTTVDTGVLVDISCRSMADGAIYCEVSPEVSNVIDFIGNIPRVARRSMVGEAILSNGGVVVLGGLTTDTDRRNTNGLAGLDVFNTRKRDEARSRLFVFVTVHQVN